MSKNKKPMCPECRGKGLLLPKDYFTNPLGASLVPCPRCNTNPRGIATSPATPIIETKPDLKKRAAGDTE